MKSDENSIDLICLSPTGLTCRASLARAGERRARDLYGPSTRIPEYIEGTYLVPARNCELSHCPYPKFIFPPLIPNLGVCDSQVLHPASEKRTESKSNLG